MHILALLLVLFCVFREARPSTVYDNIPDSLPTNVPSLGYEASATTQFGNYITLSSATSLCGVSVATVLSAQAAHSDFPSYPTDGWNWNITLSLYDVDSETICDPVIESPVLYQQTNSFFVPWRPPTDPTCGGYDWRDSDGNCHSGVAFEIVFDLPFDVVHLSPSMVVGISYNTKDYGFSPVNVSGPYDSLNAGLATSDPTIGQNTINGTAFLNSSDASSYNDDGAGGVGIFRVDYEWYPYSLLLTIDSDSCPPTVCTGIPDKRSVPKLNSIVKKA